MKHTDPQSIQVASMKFHDTKKWGQWSFLDILERNNIAFKYDGVNLEFFNKEHQQRAAAIWYNLSGSKFIGSFADQ